MTVPPDEKGRPPITTPGARRPHQPPPPLEVAGHPECKADGRQGCGKAPTGVPCTWNHPQDLHAQLRRRGVAASRSVPLHCGCRDPHACRCTPPPPSAVMVDAGAAAAAHLLAHKLMPLLDIDTLRALWRRGGADRALVAQLNDYGLAR